MKMARDRASICSIHLSNTSYGCGGRAASSAKLTKATDFQTSFEAPALMSSAIASPKVWASVSAIAHLANSFRCLLKEDLPSMI